MISETVWLIIVFLSTLSLRRATRVFYWLKVTEAISIHALLAESDGLSRDEDGAYRVISIHALLAESNKKISALERAEHYFYPRSPCGERRAHSGQMPSWADFISIHALLAESDFF